MATPEPAYTLEIHDGDFQVRRYAPRIVAETTLDGSFRDAGNTGFRRLARYIFGHNRARAKVAMTAPVGERAAGGTARSLAMTAPVGERAAAGESRWTITFTMPAGETLASLPEPLDPAVTLHEVPHRRVAVMRRRGRWTERGFAEMTAELRAWARGRGLEPLGEPEVNRYDPPWTPWFLRRNEVWLPLADTPHES